MNKAMTLVEIMVVSAIFTALFVLVLTILTNSNLTWRVGQDKLTEQQEARRAMMNMGSLLRESNPNWLINGTPYRANISEGSSRIDFYQPLFDGTGNIVTLRKVTYKLNPSNSQQLLLKEGTSLERVIANNVSSLNFGGGCSGCGAFNCTTVAQDCPMVTIEVRTRKQNDFNLTSQITLRNQNVTIAGNVTVEQP